jgi:ketosteroid isomerase-like protein
MMVAMRILKITFLTFAVAGLCLAQQKGGQKGGNARAAIEKAEQDWSGAVRSGDASAMAKILADDLVYTHSTGIVDTKESYIQSITSGNQKYAGIEYSDTKIKVYGRAALVTTVVRMTGTTKGVPFDNKLRMSHFWVRDAQGTDWKLASHQTTRLP